MSPKKIINSNIVLPLVTFCISFAIYCFSLAPTYLPPDGAEFALCIQYLGICHPPGFFLYFLLGKLFTLLFPFGSLIYKANLLSALYAACTVLLLYLTMLKVNVSKSIAFVTALLFSVTSSFWYFALSAEVFTFATFLLSLTIYIALSGKKYLSFFFLGLLTSHFPNNIVLLPIFIWYFTKFKQAVMTRSIGYVLVFLVGLLPFIILLFMRMLQNPLFNWGHVTTIQQFVDYLSRKEFGGVFLASNPAFVFTVSNFFSHLYLFILALLSQFGWIVPIVACFTLAKDKLFKNDKILPLIIIFFSLAGITILSLSSIDPFATSEFQFDKFYLPAFSILTIIIGTGINKLKDNGIKNELMVGILIIILLFQFFSNWNTHNLSSNYFSKNMIENALDELPANAIVITIANQNFFGSWYEQLHTNKYKNLTLVYFPNNTNLDFEKYHPELLSGKPIETIEARTRETNNSVYKAVLEIIAQNSGKPIFIWQGDPFNPSRPEFNGLLFPYGLWWKVSYSQDTNLKDITASQKLLANLINKQTDVAALSNSQKAADLNVYSSAYFATGTELAKIGKYADAIILLNRILIIDPNNPHTTLINNEIATINEIKNVEPTLQSLVNTKDETTLMRLAQDYYFLGNYQKAIEIYKEILLFDPKNAETYSNLGALYATINDKKNSLLYFNKALTLNPTLDLAIQGKNKLENTR